MSGDLNGKVAIVTGAAQGIGRGVSIALAKAGVSIGLVDINEDALADAVAEIEALGVRAVGVRCDVGSRADVNAAVAKVNEALGPVYVLVNNAIKVYLEPLIDITDEHLDVTVRTGAFASLYFMQACFPMMKEYGGRIINFGSGAATMGMEEKGSYAISKEGTRGLTKVAASEWGRYNITTNTICPNSPTPLFHEWYDQLTPEEQAAHIELYPMRRFGDPEKDIGATVVFLAGPGGSFICGRTIHVDGGICGYDK